MIQETIKQNPSLEYNFSLLTRTAFGADKAACLEVMSPLDIQTFLLSGKQIPKPEELLENVPEHQAGEEEIDT